jgi:hypothetical protein
VYVLVVYAVAASAGKTPRFVAAGAAVLLDSVPPNVPPVMFTFSEEPVALSAVVPANISALTPITT